MSSVRRINASRANGARSRGPATPEGKARSSQNAVTHGLLSRAVVLGAESKEAFEALFEDFVTCFAPVGTVELTLVEEMAVSTWRQRRCWAVETRMVDEAAARSAAGPVSSIASAYTDLASGPALPLIHRYEARIHKMYQRALNNLLLLRETIEMPNEPNPISEHSAGPPEPAAPTLEISIPPLVIP